MTLKDTIKEDMKAAFKSGDTDTRGTLQLLLAVIQNRELEKRTKLMKAGAITEAEVNEKSQLTDEEVIDALSSEIKKRKESITTYDQAGRPELADGERKELAVLVRYMPEQLSDEAVQQLITDAIASTGATGAKEIGKVMGVVAPKVKGRFDGTRLSELVRQALGA